jgi:hypothetical protein
MLQLGLLGGTFTGRTMVGEEVQDTLLGLIVDEMVF